VGSLMNHNRHQKSRQRLRNIEEDRIQIIHAPFISNTAI
jgi:hypothetical protein